MEIQIGIPAVEMLLHYAVSGIGSIAGPLTAGWRAQKEADAKVITARGDAEVLEIQAAAQSRAVSIAAGGYEEARRIVQSTDYTQSELTVSDLIEQKVMFQETRRLGNVEAVVGTAKQLVGDTRVSEHEPDHDWVARFFAYIQDVSSENVQLLWARVLAGEVERPGSTSLRTLGILRNLDQSTAKSFRRFCSISMTVVVEDDVLVSSVLSLGKSAGQNALEPYGLSYTTLNVLNEHGLIISDYRYGFDARICVGLPLDDGSIFHLPIIYQGASWMLNLIDDRKSGQRFDLGGVALTKAGQELARVIEAEAVPAYDVALKRYLQEQGVRMIPTL